MDWFLFQTANEMDRTMTGKKIYRQADRMDYRIHFHLGLSGIFRLFITHDTFG